MLSVTHSHGTNYDRFFHRQSTKSGVLNLYKFIDTAKPPNSGILREIISPCKKPSMNSDMNKSDRIVLLFLGLGIWVLALTQIFESNNVNAAKTGATWSSPNITAVTRPCPKGITNLDGDGEKVDCHYLLTIPFDQLDSDPQLFK